MNLHSMKMTWEENTWGRNYRVRKFWYESSVFEIPGEKYTVNHYSQYKFMAYDLKFLKKEMATKRR